MYRFMNEEEIEINQINDLKMLHLYQLGGSDAIAVYYGNNKQINLCSMDAYYNLLMQRVLTLYSQCKNKDSIIIDETTQNVFDTAVEKGVNHTSFFNRIGKKYMNLEGALAPKFASDGVLRETLIPLLKYYLNQLYHMWNVDAAFENEPLGWHRNCVLKVRKENETFILPIRMYFTKGNECKVIIGNFLKELSSIEFEISYREDQLHVLFESREFQLFGESHFKFVAQKLNAYTTIRVSGQVVYHQDEPVAKLSGSDEALKLDPDKQKLLTDAEIDFTQATIYKLPWGGIVIYNSNESEDGKHKRTDYDLIYLEEYRSKLALKQYSHSLIENISDGLRLRTDGAVMRKLYYGDKKKEVETLFMPAGYYSGWDYKEYLENRYFYHEMEEAQ